MANLQSLIYTNEKCIGCNKCINVCPAMGACTSVDVDGNTRRIAVNGTYCVSCGACMDACVHGAREFNDDTERFFADLRAGQRISLLLAPAFLANYPAQYGSVLGGLKQLGVNRIISVSFGADICTWGYINYIKKYNYLGGISQPCPAVVRYIENYTPELLPKLFPIHSPMMCTAVYCRKTLNMTDKLAFISPCVAKKL
ncbi:MAG: 4Fe-4S binding protein, partial [Ruminiclostridium sp.]|nr:4Fe-4S binding protein [Ruminiclostridium sp.]